MKTLENMDRADENAEAYLVLNPSSYQIRTKSLTMVWKILGFMKSST